MNARRPFAEVSRHKSKFPEVDVPRSSPVVALMTLCIGLAGCAPASPAGVPEGAESEWSLKDDWVWTWEQALRSGCVLWMAKESWVSVHLSVEPQDCEGGPSLSYLSFQDELVFRNHWPDDEDYGVFVYDGQGMISGIRPCPHSLSPERIEALRDVAREALAHATTDGERRILSRIDQRLEATNGAALASAQFGCSDGSLVLTREPTQVTDLWDIADAP